MTRYGVARHSILRYTPERDDEPITVSGAAACSRNGPTMGTDFVH